MEWEMCISAMYLSHESGTVVKIHLAVRKFATPGCSDQKNVIPYDQWSPRWHGCTCCTRTSTSKRGCTKQLSITRAQWKSKSYAMHTCAYTATDTHELGILLCCGVKGGHGKWKVLNKWGNSTAIPRRTILRFRWSNNKMKAVDEIYRLQGWEVARDERGGEAWKNI